MNLMRSNCSDDITYVTTKKSGVFFPFLKTYFPKGKVTNIAQLLCQAANQALL